MQYCDISQEEKSLLLQLNLTKCKKDETFLKEIEWLEID